MRSGQGKTFALASIMATITPKGSHMRRVPPSESTQVSSAVINRYGDMSVRKFALVSRRANLSRGFGKWEYDSLMQTWIEWQEEVMALLRGDFGQISHRVSFDNVNWTGWRTMYVEGRSPRAAVNRVLERDL
jgi:hypothetical protein